MKTVLCNTAFIWGRKYMQQHNQQEVCSIPTEVGLVCALQDSVWDRSKDKEEKHMSSHTSFTAALTECRKVRGSGTYELQMQTVI